MKRKLLMMMCAAALGASVWAQNAVIGEIKGTVEVKTPGAAQWLPAHEGMILPKNASISTGFRSTALVALGNSTLMVRPLTRLSIEELAETRGAEQVSLRLQAGRIRAEVTPPAGGRTEFTVRSPSATASVRGTVFDFDGVNLNVVDSSVRLTGSNGRSVVVDAGGSSFVSETTGQAAAPAETAAAVLVPSLPPGSESGVTPTVIKPLLNSSGDVGLDLDW
jgi:hypothetical protein